MKKNGKKNREMADKPLVFIVAKNSIDKNYGAKITRIFIGNIQTKLTVI